MYGLGQCFSNSAGEKALKEALTKSDHLRETALAAAAEIERKRAEGRQMNGDDC